MRKHLLPLIVLLGSALQSQDLVPYRIGEFFGYSDLKGKIVIQPEYDRAGWFQDGLAPVATGCRDCWDVYDGKWGFINPAGKMVIPMQFDEAREFSEGLAPARISDKWGFIRTTGAWVIEPQFLDVQPFQNGVAWVQDTSYQWGMISNTGKIILEPQYAGIAPTCEGLTPVYNRFEWGYVDATGKRVMDMQYTAATPFYKGKAVVQKGKQYFQIDTKGKVLKQSSEAEFIWYLEPYALKRQGCTQDETMDNPIKLKLMHVSGKELVACGIYQDILIRNDVWAFVTNFKDGGWINAEGKLFAEYPIVDRLRPLSSLDLPELPTDDLKNDANFAITVKVTEGLTFNRDQAFLVYTGFSGDSTISLIQLPLEWINTDEGLDMGIDRPLTFKAYVNYALLQQLSVLDQSGKGQFMYVEQMVLPSSRLRKHPYFRLITNGTDLLDGQGQSLFYFLNGPSDLLREPQFTELRNTMLDLIHQRGKELATAGPAMATLLAYTGRTLADVMSSATIKDLDAFAAYLSAHPSQWAGKSEKLTAAFESWLSGK